MRNGTDYVIILIVLLVLSAPFWLPILIVAWNNRVFRTTPPRVPLSADAYNQRHAYLMNELEQLRDGDQNAIEAVQAKMRLLEIVRERSSSDQTPATPSRLHPRSPDIIGRLARRTKFTAGP